MSFVHRNTTTLCIEFKKKSIKLCFTSASQVSKNLFRTCWFAEILLRLKAFEATSSNANDGPKLLFLDIPRRNKFYRETTFISTR